MRRRLVVALLLVTVSLGAMMASAQRPVNDDPTNLKESECYLCHSTGGGSLGPPLPLLYLIHGPAELTIPVGGKEVLAVGVENAWVSELRDIVGVADLSNTPYLGFTSDKDPITETLEGIIEVAQNPTAERSARETFTVQPGASDLVVTLEHDGSTNQALRGEFELRLWTPGQNPDRSAPFETIDTPNDAGQYVYEVHGAKEITQLGVGEWTAEIAVPASTSSPLNTLDQPYLLTAFTDFRSTGETEEFSGTSEVLLSRVEEPSKLAYVEWTIAADGVPDEPTTLPVEIILVAHYAHGSTQISQYDDWRFTKTIDLMVLPDPDGDAVIIRANAVTPDPIPQAAFAWDILSEILGYISAVLILASIYTGGMFGKASRRQLNAVFGTAKRRVAFHNFLSYAILAAAVIHMIIFLFEAGYDWTLGIIWGGIAILAMIGLGVTGALQVPMIRKWNYAVWRWSHFYLAIGSIVFTIVHILLDGAHFTGFQDSIGWSNPFTRV